MVNKINAMNVQNKLTTWISSDDDWHQYGKYIQVDSHEFETWAFIQVGEPDSAHGNKFFVQGKTGIALKDFLSFQIYEYLAVYVGILNSFDEAKRLRQKMADLDENPLWQYDLLRVVFTAQCHLKEQMDFEFYADDIEQAKAEAERLIKQSQFKAQVG